MTILVTGATGKISGDVFPQLRAKGQSVRALVRDEAKAQKLAATGVELVKGSLEDVASLDHAFKGVKTLLLITPAGPQAFDFAVNAIEAAKRAGTKRVVRVSVINPGPDSPTHNTRAHGKTDDMILQSGLGFTILRPHFFAQNLFGSVQTIAEQGKMYWGMGDGRMGLIDTRDIADCAVNALIDSQWDGSAVNITGPESITFHDCAKILTRVLGREVTYVAVPPQAVYEQLLGTWGQWGAETMRDYSAAYSRNWADFTTQWVEKIAGHPPRSFETFAREVLAHAFKK